MIEQDEGAFGVGFAGRDLLLSLMRKPDQLLLERDLNEGLAVVEDAKL